MAIADRPSEASQFSMLLISSAPLISAQLLSVDYPEALDAANELPCGCLPIRECECQQIEPRQASA